jgi:hypothetical protein
MQAAKEPMAKHDDDRNDCPDEVTSDKEERPATKAAPTCPVAEVTGENKESNSKESINTDIDAWTASRPTKPNPTTAATTLKVNSKKSSTRPGTRGPGTRQDQHQVLAQEDQHRPGTRRGSDREEASR